MFISIFVMRNGGKKKISINQTCTHAFYIWICTDVYLTCHVILFLHDGSLCVVIYPNISVMST
jgi:hypothetical protein